MTIFSETWPQVMSDMKTQTSKVKKPGEYATYDSEGNIISIHHASGRVKWAVGHDYAIQPYRTAKSIGRYRVLELSDRNVDSFDESDADREGMHTLDEFRRVWQKLNRDKTDAWVINFKRVQ